MRALVWVDGAGVCLRHAEYEAAGFGAEFGSRFVRADSVRPLVFPGRARFVRAVGRLVWLVLLAPVMGIFFLIAHIYAPALIVLASVLLYFNSALAIIIIVVCAAAWILVLPAIGYVHVDRRYDSRISMSERWTILLIGAFAPIGFTLAMAHLPLSGVLRWLASVEVAAVLTGLISGTAIAIRSASVDRDFPLPE